MWNCRNGKPKLVKNSLFTWKFWNIVFSRKRKNIYMRQKSIPSFRRDKVWIRKWSIFLSTASCDGWFACVRSTVRCPMHVRNIMINVPHNLYSSACFEMFKKGLVFPHFFMAFLNAVKFQGLASNSKPYILIKALIWSDNWPDSNSWMSECVRNKITGILT